MPPRPKDGDKTLVSGTDYDITYKDNTNAGTVTYKVTGKGNYTGTAEGSFKIARAKVAIPAPAAGLTYNDSDQTGVAEGNEYIVANGTKKNAGDYTAEVALKDTKSLVSCLDTAAVTRKTSVPTTRLPAVRSPLSCGTRQESRRRRRMQRASPMSNPTPTTRRL